MPGFRDWRFPFIETTSQKRALPTAGYGHRIPVFKIQLFFRVFRLETVTSGSVFAEKSLEPNAEIIDLSIE